MPSTVSPRRPSRARPRAGAENLARRSNRKVRSPGVVLSRCKRRESRHQTRERLCQGSLGYDRGQQYSITALTNGGGTITERYAYDAYGTPTITDASGTTRTTSAESNRYTYTGREFDSELGLYHYRARMYDSVAGRFCSRDPIGYLDGPSQYQYVGDNPQSRMDPGGLSMLGDWWLDSYFEWYYLGLGGTVDIGETGLLDEWVGQIQSQIDKELGDVLPQGASAASCSNPSVSFSGSHSFQTTSEGGIQRTTVMGTSQVTVKYRCQTVAACEACCPKEALRYTMTTCDLSFSVRDRFANPHDWHGQNYERDEEAYQSCRSSCAARFPAWNVWNHDLRYRCEEGCSNQYPRSEYYGATPYDLIGNWTDSYSSMKHFNGCKQ